VPEGTGQLLAVSVVSELLVSGGMNSKFKNGAHRTQPAIGFAQSALRYNIHYIVQILAHSYLDPPPTSPASIAAQHLPVTTAASQQSPSCWAFRC
jgi:hypothetical protein